MLGDDAAALLWCLECVYENEHVLLLRLAQMHAASEAAALLARLPQVITLNSGVVRAGGRSTPAALDAAAAAGCLRATPLGPRKHELLSAPPAASSPA